MRANENHCELFICIGCGRDTPNGSGFCDDCDYESAGGTDEPPEGMIDDPYHGLIRDDN